LFLWEIIKKNSKAMAHNTAQQGSIVKVHYTGSLSDGEVFDSSEGAEPLEFQIGSGQVIPGFELAITGMAEGESKKFTIPSQEAYGEREESMMVTFPLSNLPEGFEPEIGAQIDLEDEDGNQIPAMVIDVDNEKIMLDANHPLAGEDLTFEITVVSIG
jgi:FKBP-type peptidyl-prolyl cis-trans isomerase 2